MRQAIRLCVIVTNLGLGGAEHALLQTLSRLDRSRFTLRLLVLGDDEALLPRFREIGIEPVLLGLHAGRWPLAGVRRLLDAVRAFQPDLIQGWMYHGNLAASFAAARLVPSVPVCWSVRDTPDAAHGHSRFTRAVIWLSGHYAPRVARIFNVSSRSAAYCAERYGWPAAATRVLPNGIDLARFRPDAAARSALRGALGVSDAQPLIGMVARWTPVKRHGLFLEAAARLLALRADARFVLVGKGLDADNAMLAALLDRHSLRERCHLLGMRHDVETIYPGLDLLALTSASEGFPNVLAEAMACGVPVVSTDVGDARDILGGLGAIVQDDPASIAQAWASGLAGQGGTPEQLRARIAGHYALDGVAARFMAEYEALLD